MVRQTLAWARFLTVVTYVVAVLVGWGVFALLAEEHPLVSLFAADLAGTVVVFAASVIFANASLYDPYWSVAPPLIIVGFMSTTDSAPTLRQLVLLVLVLVWAVRLTANWATGWRGLSHEDWRYVQMREQTRGRLPWWLVNLVGVQLVPTLFVFIGLLAAWPAVIGTRPFGVLDVLAVVVMAGSIALEAISDRQLHRFVAANPGKAVQVGLWKHSRHPNYLGEIGLWWGIWLFGLAAAPNWWWTVIGPLAMVGLFVGISIPMMERRSLARRPEYAAYRRDVPMLIPWRMAHLELPRWRSY